MNTLPLRKLKRIWFPNKDKVPTPVLSPFLIPVFKISRMISKYCCSSCLQKAICSYNLSDRDKVTFVVVFGERLNLISRKKICQNSARVRICEKQLYR